MDAITNIGIRGKGALCPPKKKKKKKKLKLKILGKNQAIGGQKSGKFRAGVFSLFCLSKYFYLSLSPTSVYFKRAEDGGGGGGGGGGEFSGRSVRHSITMKHQVIQDTG